uniref:AT5G62050 protein n=1 Tax=Arabidopsis thaliana TaxID=3702 RepID=C0Z2L1_ARATH|nr:AT5G62050 [Arabidopsis thaliana]
MAFRQTLSIRSRLFARRNQPVYHIIPRESDHERDSFCQETSQRSYHSFLHQRSVNNSDFSKVSGGSLHLPLAPTSGFAFYRYMSSAPSPVNPRLSSTSLSPVSKRLKALESQVKGRKKNSSKKK